MERIRNRHPRFAEADDPALAAGPFRLNDAQLVIAREYGLHNWKILKLRIEANSAANALEAAIRADDRDAAVQLIQANPQLLHIPLHNGNWGPPMSHAANIGRLEIIKAMAALGAKDFQHAFDRGNATSVSFAFTIRLPRNSMACRGRALSLLTNGTKSADYLHLESGTALSGQLMSRR